MSTTDERLSAILTRAQRIEQDSFNEFWSLVAESASILRELHPNQRRPWLSHVIEELWDSQQGCCALCGLSLTRSSIDVDHRIPFCYGGGNERANLQLAHPQCNRAKRTSVDPKDLMRYLEDRYMNR